MGKSKAVQTMEIIESKEGKLIFPMPSSADQNFIVQCVSRHQWPTTKNLVLSGKWCPMCARIPVVEEVVEEDDE